ncbi:unnamed protein product [Leptidea sinapis]|uniref:Nose resistant-to-fluoxetine protein N-terminal domain-containing protein n=1 Tax=Leptidea sinapis TaxID=189913 RepID=A0A5E4R584_9NEOP|nr:unnamed protein product [Leptidea sinapis]
MDLITVNPANAFDNILYRQVLDSQQCEKQLTFLSSNALATLFVDASGKIPNGIMSGNLIDYGDYHQCLGINNSINGMMIAGKHCTLKIPFLQNDLSLFNISSNDSSITSFIRSLVSGVNLLQEYKTLLNTTFLGEPALTVGICIPKVCSVSQVAEYITKGLGVSVNDSQARVSSFCRLPQDKPSSVCDYISMCWLSIILLLTLLATCYDLFTQYKSTSGNTLITSFSLTKNVQRIFAFKKSNNYIECIDGIRALSMLWVILGHTYVGIFLLPLHNVVGILEWVQCSMSCLINAASLSVDTFLLLSGLFCIYSIPNNVTSERYVASLHLFYLHRLIRIMPLLASVVLLQSTVFHWISDGPHWTVMGNAVETCRVRWWSTLLQIQNYVKPVEICLPQSWYLSMDTQLVFISPVISYWLLGTKLKAICALILALSLTLSSVIISSYTNNYPANILNPIILRTTTSTR